MDGMAPAPNVVGRQRHCAEHAAHPVVDGAATKECAVAAIMLDHEEAHEEARCRYSEEKAQPIAEANGRPYQKP